MPTATTTARDRLLLAAAQLLTESGDRTASTRAICERAGVQAPTLYHHFGSKQGLVDAVVNHGFTQYVAGQARSDDPLADVRAGWDRHVQFGLEHPAFYGLLYGQVERGRPCGVTAPALAMLVELFTVAARRGLLAATPAEAASQLLAANVGVTLALIAQPVGEEDLGLSERVREAALGAVLAGSGRVGDAAGAGGPSRAAAALTLRALVEEDAEGLSPGETTLLKELLDRLGRS